MKRLYIVISRVKELVAKERSVGFSVPLKTRIVSWRRGFLSESEAFYDWSHNDWREYLTDWERFVFCPDVNGCHTVILDDKDVFRKIVGLILPVPRHIGRLDQRMPRRCVKGEELD